MCKCIIQKNLFTIESGNEIKRTTISLNKMVCFRNIWDKENTEFSLFTDDWIEFTTQRLLRIWD